MKRIVMHGMKESGWFADNPTNPHVAGATAASGPESGGKIEFDTRGRIATTDRQRIQGEWENIVDTVPGRRPTFDTLKSYIDKQELPKSDATSHSKRTGKEVVEIVLQRAKQLSDVGAGIMDPLEVMETAMAYWKQDSKIRGQGKHFSAKFAGTDAITGERFSAGTPIIYSYGDAVIE
jgi:hypothetical protein